MYSRLEFVFSILSRMGISVPHTFFLRWLLSWSLFETPKPDSGYLHNLFNATEPGYGSGLFYPVHATSVKDYPTLEDGIAATVAQIERTCPKLVEALKTGNGDALFHLTEDIRRELKGWSNGDYADCILEQTISSDVYPKGWDDMFVGRHAGQQN